MGLRFVLKNKPKCKGISTFFLIIILYSCFITLPKHCWCPFAEPAYLSDYSQTAEGYPCARHCRGNERTQRHFLWSLVLCWRNDKEGYYSIPSLFNDLGSQMCSPATVGGVICVGFNPTGSHATRQTGCFGHSELWWTFNSRPLL